MIRKLLFTAALLFPGLAYAGSPSADLSVQVVPADPPSSITPDYGPNYVCSGAFCTSGIPTPAYNAGFTHMALNGDFSNSLYSNISTWLTGCGAAGWPAWNFSWGFRFGNNGPCNRIDMEPDSTIGGEQVLHIQFRNSDTTTYNTDAFALSWPTGWTTASSGSGTLPMEAYFEITFRFTSASLSEGASPAGPLDIYWNSVVNGGTSGNIEPDFMEIDPHPPNWGGGLIDWLSNGPNFGDMYGGTGIFTVDVSQYHTLQVLLTSDESTVFSKCTWIDGVATETGCVQISPQNNPNCNGCAPAIYQLHTLEPNVWVGSGGVSIANNIDMYIQSIRIWECAGYKASVSETTGCPGTVITTH